LGHEYFPSHSEPSFSETLIGFPTNDVEIAENQPDFGIVPSKNRFMHQSHTKLSKESQLINGTNVK
jgi:hypothetical protein